MGEKDRIRNLPIFGSPTYEPFRFSTQYLVVDREYGPETIATFETKEQADFYGPLLEDMQARLSAAEAVCRAAQKLDDLTTHATHDDELQCWRILREALAAWEAAREEQL